MKTVTIEIPENTELVKTETGYEVRLIDEEKKWEDFGEISGYYVDSDSSVKYHNSDKSHKHTRNVFPTEKEAEIYGIIMPMLLQYRNKVNKDWKPDWEDINQTKWCICQDRNYMIITNLYTAFRHLHFQTQSIAEQFYKDHKTLIDKLIQ